MDNFEVKEESGQHVVYWGGHRMPFDCLSQMFLFINALAKYIEMKQLERFIKTMRQETPMPDLPPIPVKPTIVTLAPEISDTVILKGKLTDLGTNDNIKLYFAYAPTNEYNGWTYVRSSTAPIEYSLEVTLIPDTDYWYYAGGIVVGAEWISTRGDFVYFHTPSLTPPEPTPEPEPEPEPEPDPPKPPKPPKERPPKSKKWWNKVADFFKKLLGL